MLHPFICLTYIYTYWVKKIYNGNFMELKMITKIFSNLFKAAENEFREIESPHFLLTNLIHIIKNIENVFFNKKTHLSCSMIILLTSQSIFMYVLSTITQHDPIHYVTVLLSSSSWWVGHIMKWLWWCDTYKYCFVGFLNPRTLYIT